MTRLIAFEGLSALLWPWAVPSHVKRGLLDNIPYLMRESTEVWRGGFMSSGPDPLKAGWKHQSDKIIVVAHSMGGPTGIGWCNNWAEWFNIDLLLTFDPRPLHRPYVKPANVKRCVNFYQTGFMRGYEIEGATNFNVTGYASHTGLPAHPKAREILLEAL